MKIDDITITEIARKLKEDIALSKTVDRLSRNLMSFNKTEQLRENYFDTVSKHFDERTVLIVDDSDIAKIYSEKLEGLCRVRDGSTGEIVDGYWFAGVSALTAGHKQPIPIYSRVYSSKEKDYTSNNSETIKSLEFLSSHFPKTNIRALDRGYDGGYVFDYFIPRGESFIVRLGAMVKSRRVWQYDIFFARRGVFPQEYHWYFKEKQRSMAKNRAF